MDWMIDLIMALLIAVGVLALVVPLVFGLNKLYDKWFGKDNSQKDEHSQFNDLRG